jgi:hypothetical protein
MINALAAGSNVDPSPNPLKMTLMIITLERKSPLRKEEGYMAKCEYYDK